MKIKSVIFIAIILFLAACGEADYVPKPRIYPKVELPAKAYKNFDFGRIWAAMSYRTSSDLVEQLTESGPSQKLNYLTPILGVNYKNFMFAYTYSYLPGVINFDTAGFHQITLGIDLFCQPEKYDCNCPAIN